MHIVTEKKKLLPEIKAVRSEGKTIGFVPTMGALHAGHISLVEQAKQWCDVVVASIFVNPRQFNNTADLKAYPRMPESDFAILRQAGCSWVYYPQVEDIYPSGNVVETYDLGFLDTIMEGKYRPGHFQGVAAVVKRLFEAVEPDVAFFGEKDYQQIQVVKRMVELEGLPIKIETCPVLREGDGLAMSSRNLRLTAEQRKAAPAIFEALQYCKSVALTKKAPEKARATAIEMINNHPVLATEYLEIVDEESLRPIKNWSDAERLRAFTAVYAGDVRLIDNIALY